MADFTKWERKSFGDPHGVPAGRADAERETNQDVQKPIQQLLCDVHEQAKMPAISPEAQQRYVTVRMASLMARVGLEHERVNNSILRLTWAIVVLTVFVVILTFALLRQG